jgi:hypothetical protein
MTIQEILEDKTTKPKEKTEQLSKCIIDGLIKESSQLLCCKYSIIAVLCTL